MVLKSKEEEAAVHVLTPDFQGGGSVRAGPTAAPGSLPRGRVRGPAACVATRASDLCAGRLGISSDTPVKMRCCWNAPYFWPAEKEALSAQLRQPRELNGPRRPSAAPAPAAAGSEHHLLPLRGSLAAPLRGALLH